MKKLFPLLFICFFFACEKSNDQPKVEGCDALILEQLGYVEGEVDFTTFNCKEYLNKFRAPDGEFFYVPDCTCCDMALRVYNCAGVDICNADGQCSGFAEMELVGIAGKR